MAGTVTVDAANPLLLLLAGMGAMSTVVAVLFKAYEHRTEQLLREKAQRITWLEDRLRISDTREGALIDAAMAGVGVVERQSRVLDRVMPTVVERGGVR